MQRWILRIVAFSAAVSTVQAGLAMASSAQDTATQAGTAIAAAAERPAPSARDLASSGSVSLDAKPDIAQPTRAWPTRIRTHLEGLTPSAHALDPAAPIDVRPDRSLRADLAFLEARPGHHISVHARDLDNGRVLVDLEGGRARNPASNQKILTSMAALELLGADYRFETRFAVRGTTLFVIGEGDPSLMLDDVHEMVADFVATGQADAIDRIVVDDGAFSSRRFGPGYDPEGHGASYMAPSGALSVNFNTVEVVVRPDVDAPQGAEVELVPPSTMSVFDVAVRQGRANLDVATSDDAGLTRVHVHGSMPAGHGPTRDRRRVTDPGLFTGGTVAVALADHLGRAPVPVVRGTTPRGAQVVTRHQSAPLVEVLASAMKYSNNFTTEQVLRTLAWRATGRPGDWSDGVGIVQRYWQAVGRDPEAFEFINGSGLNRHGRATARAFVDLVARASEADADARAIDAIMARSGGEGTMHYRLGGLRGRVRAKTGTMASVSALSGTVVSRDGNKRIAFSILVNGMDVERARATQDRVVRALASYADRRG